MAATVEGVMRIIDRASRPMRDMERQARRTERAAESAGDRLDRVGSARQQRQMRATEGRMRGLATQTDRTNTSLTRIDRSVTRLDRNMGGLAQRVNVLGGAFRGLSTLAKPALFLALASAIKPLLGAVSALGGGVAGLVGSLGSLGGAAAALPSLLLGIMGATKVTAFAMGDLKQAMGGNKEAIKALTPEARSFMRTLKQYAPVIKDLRREAGKGLFPGLEVGLKRMQKGIPLATKFVRQMGEAVGKAAKQWASFLTERGTLVDFGAMGRQATTTFDRMQRGARNIAAALIDIVRAAEPFTDWLTRTMLGWTTDLRKFFQASRESGRLGAFFERLQGRMKVVFSITGNLFRILLAGFKAATPLGDDLLKTFDRMTEGWAKFMEGTRGQRSLAVYFESIRPTLRELGGLTGDLAKALGRLMGPASQGQATTFIAGIRRLVPILENILNTASAAFGPALIDGIVTLGKTIDTLVGQGSSPLMMLLTTITQILGFVNSLVDAVPGLGNVLAAAFTVVGINRLIGRLGGMVPLVGSLAARWRGVTTAAEAAALAQTAATGGVRGGPGGGIAGGLSATAAVGAGVLAEQAGEQVSSAVTDAVSERLQGGIDERLSGGRGDTMSPGGSIGYNPATGQPQLPNTSTNPAYSSSMPSVIAAGGLVSPVTRSGDARIRPLPGGPPAGGTVAGGRVSTALLGSTAAAGYATARAAGQNPARALSAAARYERQQAPIQAAAAQTRARAEKLARSSNPAIAARGQAVLAQQDARALRNAPAARATPSLAGRAGAALPRGAAAAGRFVAPLAAIQAAMSAISTQGTIGERANNAISMGGLFGAKDLTGKEVTSNAQQSAMATAQQGGLAGVQKQIAHVEAALADPTRRQSGVSKFLGGGDASILGVKSTSGSNTITDREREQSSAELKALKTAAGALRKEQARVDRANARARNLTLNEQSKQNALVALSSWESAHKTYSKRFGPEKAMKKTVGGVIAQMRTMRPAGAKVLGENTLAWAKEMEGKNKALTGTTARMAERIERNFSRLGRRVKVINGVILQGTKSEWSAIGKAMSDPAERARQEVSAAFTSMQQQAVGSLQAMGYSKSEATSLVRDLEKGGRAGAVAKDDATRVVAGGRASTAGARQKVGLAQGGRINGTGLKDTVPVAPGHMAAPGELIVNRHTEARVAQKYGVNLGAEVANEGRKHDQPIQHQHNHTRGGRITFAATGERVTEAGGMHWSGGSTTAFARAIAGRFGLSLGSGYRSPARNAAVGGSPTSDHMKGSAANPGAWDVPVNVGDPRGDQLAAAAKAAGVPQVLWRVADHYDHVHLGFGGGGAGSQIGTGGGAAAGTAAPMVAQVMEALKPAASKVGGLPGAMSNLAQKGIAAGLTAKINKSLEANAAASGGGPTGGGGPAPAGQIRDWLTEALQATNHFSEGNLNALYSRVMQESGGNPNAVNNWDSNAKAGTPSKGLIQTIEPTFNAHKMPGHDNIFNPVDNSIAAINYMFSRYGHIVGANGRGYALGGRIPGDGGLPDGGAFGEGGDFMATKPQRITVGDGGRERVNVTPVGKGGGRGQSNGTMSVVIHINGGGGDVKEQVEEALMEVARKLDMTTMETEA